MKIANLLRKLEIILVLSMLPPAAHLLWHWSVPYWSLTPALQQSMNSACQALPDCERASVALYYDNAAGQFRPKLAVSVRKQTVGRHPTPIDANPTLDAMRTAFADRTRYGVWWLLGLPLAVEGK